MNSGVLPNTQLDIGMVLVPVAALLCVFHTLENALESGQKAWIMQIDFRAAFDRVNHLGIIYKLCSLGIGGSMSSAPTQFLSNRIQHVMVDDFQGKVVNFVSGVQGSVFGPFILPPVNLVAFFHYGE